MIIYPAIDLQKGRCVRLKQGRKEDETVYADRPEEMAEKWIDQGAKILHVVDLDAAFGDGTANQAAIQAICALAKARGIPVQLGGGVRTMEAVKIRMRWGADRLVVGTAALENPDFVREAVRKYPGRIVAGIDAKDGLVLTRGWEQGSDVRAVDLALKLKGYGISHCVYTDISRDGMMGGPNILETLRIQEESGMQVIASGGVSALGDIERLTAAGLHAAIVGRALYEEAFTLKEAIETAKGRN